MANLPPNPPRMPKKLFKLLIVVILLCFSFFIGYWVGMTQPPADGGYQAGFAAAKQRLTQAGFFTSQVKVTSVSGNVTSVDGSTFEMTTPTAAQNPLDDPTPGTREVTVNADTKIYRVENKTAAEIESDQKEFADEIKKYQDSVAAGKEAAYPESPAAVKRTEITLSDVKAGDLVSVTAADDIAYATTFVATEINVLPPTSVGGTAPPPEPAEPTHAE